MTTTAKTTGKAKSKAMKKKSLHRRRLPLRRWRPFDPAILHHQQRHYVAREIVGQMSKRGLVDPTIVHLLIDAHQSEEEARKPEEVRKNEMESRGFRRRRHGKVPTLEERVFDLADEFSLDFLIAEIVHAATGVARRISEGQVQRLAVSAWDKAFLFAREQEVRRPPERAPAKLAKKVAKGSTKKAKTRVARPIPNP